MGNQMQSPCVASEPLHSCIFCGKLFAVNTRASTLPVGHDCHRMCYSFRPTAIPHGLIMALRLISFVFHCCLSLRKFQPLYHFVPYPQRPGTCHRPSTSQPFKLAIKSKPQHFTDISALQLRIALLEGPRHYQYFRRGS